MLKVTFVDSSQIHSPLEGSIFYEITIPIMYTAKLNILWISNPIIRLPLESAF